jgi:hypothetical protein
MTLLKVSDVARKLSLHQNTVRSLIKTGRLPAIWLSSPGGRARVRVRAEDLAYLISDPRQISCDLCEGLIPWDAIACLRCGCVNHRNQRHGN